MLSSKKNKKFKIPFYSNSHRQIKENNILMRNNNNNAYKYAYKLTSKK